MKADLLAQEFASEALPNAGGRLLLDAGDAVALIGRATEEGVPILAVRGVRLGGAALAPGGAPPEHSVDYAAGVAEGHGCWDDAEAFVRARRDRGLAFEVLLGDDPIEAV